MSSTQFFVAAYRLRVYRTVFSRDKKLKSVYGPNLAYVEFDRDRVSLFRLYVYSERNGKVIVDPEFSRFWKVMADEHGITCHRYQGGYERDDPQPVIYTAEYLSGL